jgi:hypothetical protein
VRKGASQLDDVARTAGINPHRQFFRHGEIVSRGEMKHARRLSLDQFEIGGTQRQLRFADVSFDKLKLSHISSRGLRDPSDLCARALKQRRLHEEDEIAVLPRESFEEPVRNEARKSCYEECLSIRHRLP